MQLIEHKLNIFDKILIHSKYEQNQVELLTLSKMIMTNILDKLKTTGVNYKYRLKSLGRFLCKTELDYSGNAMANKDIFGCQLDVDKEFFSNEKRVNKIMKDTIKLFDEVYFLGTRFDKSYMLSHWRVKTYKFEIKFVFYEQPEHIEYEIKRLKKIDLNNIDKEIHYKVQSIVIHEILNKTSAQKFSIRLNKLLECSIDQFNFELDLLMKDCSMRGDELIIIEEIKRDKIQSKKRKVILNDN